MRKILFYTTAGCHLCELAEQLLQALNPELIQIEAVDISDSDQLIERYGVRIPVLADSLSDNELGWPFDQEQLLDYLESLDWGEDGSCS